MKGVIAMKLRSVLMYSCCTAIVAIPMSILSCFVFALEDCTESIPKEPELCGAQSNCNPQNLPCSGNITNQNTRCLDCVDDGTCSQSCDELGETDCTATYQCAPIGERCSIGDPVLDGCGEPVVSTTTEYGAVSCHDTCGG